MDEGATVALAATDQLLGDLADAVPALRAVVNALDVLADGLGVDRVIVAVDDATLGRQVFCSGRVPLGEDGVGLFGPAGAWTEPPREIDSVATLLLVRTVGVGVTRSTRRVTTAAASAEITSLPDPSEGIGDTVVAATARAVRHGWGFTLVLARGGLGLADALKPRLRAADTLVAVSNHEVALLLPETAGDRVPQILARLAEGSGIPTFSYGLACCPADGTDAELLHRIATERLDDALRAIAGT
jgi:hypothetical protein